MEKHILIFDTEFTKLSKDGKLLSIGICDTLTSKTFYAECTDNIEEYINSEEYKNNEFMKNNVIPNLISQLPNNEISLKDNDATIILDSFIFVSDALLKWLYDLHNKLNIPILFAADVNHYDFVHLIDLLTKGGTAFDIPKYVLPWCIDYNIELNNYIELLEVQAKNKGKNLIDAFDISREKLYQKIYNGKPNWVEKKIRLVFGGTFDIDTLKHNALYDALIIKYSWESFNTYRSMEMAKIISES